MIKESIGLYVTEELSTLVHVTQTKEGIDVVNQKGGSLGELAAYIIPYYDQHISYVSRDGRRPNLQEYRPHFVPLTVSAPFEKMIFFQGDNETVFSKAAELNERYWAQIFDQETNETEQPSFSRHVAVLKVDLNYLIERLLKAKITPSGIVTTAHALRYLRPAGAFVYEERTTRDGLANAPQTPACVALNPQGTGTVRCICFGDEYFDLRDYTLSRSSSPSSRRDADYHIGKAIGKFIDFFDATTIDFGEALKSVCILNQTQLPNEIAEGIKKTGRQITTRQSLLREGSLRNGEEGFLNLRGIDDYIALGAALGGLKGIKPLFAVK